jgi:urease accessory protein
MNLADLAVDALWRAELALDYERRGPRTVLAARRHDGPLLVQKPFYPEGEDVCHSIIVHPPAGIAGGDSLQLHARAGEHARVLLTTPGAAKWYRSAGPWARQKIIADIGPGACIEWLPQETILFDGALAEMKTDIRLAKDASYIGWEILCFGRTGSGETYQHGACRINTWVRREDKLLWVERGCIEGEALLARSPAGLGNKTVCGSLLAVSEVISRELLEACRAVDARTGATAVTRLPGMIIARYLGDSSEAAKNYFVAVWEQLRPALAGKTATAPRIWRT